MVHREVLVRSEGGDMLDEVECHWVGEKARRNRELGHNERRWDWW